MPTGYCRNPITTAKLVAGRSAGPCVGRTIGVAASPSNSTDNVMPDAYYLNSYMGFLYGFGGIPPYTGFAIIPGVLPPGQGLLPSGLTLNTGGEVTGTPTDIGIFKFAVRCADANGCCAGVSIIQLTVSSCPEITLDDTLPDGVVGTAYTGQVTASGGAEPYTYAVTDGSLPPGLSMDATGAITGTPTTAGAYTFTITTTDKNGCMGSRAYAVTITAPTLCASLPCANCVGSQPSMQVSTSGGAVWDGTYLFNVFTFCAWDWIHDGLVGGRSLDLTIAFNPDTCALTFGGDYGGAEPPWASGAWPMASSTLLCVGGTLTGVVTFNGTGADAGRTITMTLG